MRQEQIREELIELRNDLKQIAMELEVASK
jgi:hypothetical protein